MSQSLQTQKLHISGVEVPLLKKKKKKFLPKNRIYLLCSTHFLLYNNVNQLCVKVAQLTPTLCNPWTIQSKEFSRPEYWSRQPFPSPGELPDPGIEPRSPTLQADPLPAELPGNQLCVYIYPIPLGLPSCPASTLPPRSSQSTELSFLCCSAASRQLSILHMVVCM